MQNPFLLLDRALGIWAWNIYTRYVKRIFCLYGNVSQKKLSYINLNSNHSPQQKTTCTFLYIRIVKKLQNIYIYLQKDRHFTRSKIICVPFLFTQIRTLYLTRFFIKKLKLAFIFIQMHDTLRCVKFLYAKVPTLRKTYETLRLVFLFTKSLTLCVTQFLIQFWN